MANNNAAIFADRLDKNIAENGNTSTHAIYKLSRVSNMLIILITVIGLMFLTENYLANADLPDIFWASGYAVGLLLAGGATIYITSIGENAKQVLMRNVVFRSTVLLSLVGLFAVVGAFIAGNIKGVTAIQNYATRSFNETIMQDHAVKLDIDSSTTLKGILAGGGDQIKSLQDQKLEIKRAADAAIKGLDASNYRTKILSIRNDAQSKIDKIDKKITAAMEKAEKTAASVQSKNDAAKATIREKTAAFEKDAANYANIGIYVSVALEVIDAFFIWLYLMLHRQNPNTSGVVNVERNIRKVAKLGKQQTEAEPTQTATVGKMNTPEMFESDLTHKSFDYSDDDIYDHVMREAHKVNEERLIKKGLSYLYQPTQRHLVATLTGLTPLMLAGYNTRMMNKGKLIQAPNKRFALAETGKVHEGVAA